MTASTPSPPSNPTKTNPLRKLIQQILSVQNLVILGLSLALITSVAINVWSSYQRDWYLAPAAGLQERFHSGDDQARDRILLLKIRGTIMPPFTERILKSIEQAQKDPRVLGVLLSIDSPGGLVADSHQIFHRLQKLNKSKPVFVAMKRMAASGGLYIAMGAGPEGRIFAEPTTWTGSIGVIIPRFDASGLAEKVGFRSDALKTGPFKDSLNPFRELSEADRELWRAILDESFVRFKTVIAENRERLDAQAVDQLATGQLFTATQALDSHLIDEIGFEDDALEALQNHLQIDKVRVVTYHSDPGWIDLVLDQLKASHEDRSFQRLMEATVPKAMYYASWAPELH